MPLFDITTSLLAFFLLSVFYLLVPMSLSMRVNPERIAARLRIEQEIEMDKLFNRNRRQLATPKEISISVSFISFQRSLFVLAIAIVFNANCIKEKMMIRRDSMSFHKPLKHFMVEYFLW